MENLALNVIENVASASALIAFQGPLSSKKGGYTVHKPFSLWDLLQEPGEGICLCVWGGAVLGGPTAGILGRQISEQSPQHWSMLCPHSRLGPGTCGSWAKHLVPRARSHWEEARAFSLVSGLECGRMQVFYEACSMNICHWPFGLLKLTISLVISTTSFQCPLTLPS